MAVKITITSNFNDKGVKASIRSMEDFNRAAKIAGGGFSGYAQIVGKMSQQVGQNITRTGETLTKNLTLPLVAVGAGLYKATQAAAEDAAAQANLANVLENTTGATKNQVAAVEDWITAQGKALGIADDQLRPALVTLAGATKDVGTAQKLAAMSMDIARAKGVSVEVAAKAVAKAYAGQGTALNRLLPGIDQAAIKSGDFGKIQMAVFNTVGGAAEKYANTAAGAQEKAKIAFQEATEQLGTAFMPIMTQVANIVTTKVVPAIQKMADWFSKLSPQQKDMILKAGLVAAALGPMAVVLGKVTSGIGSTVVAMSKMPGAFAKVASGFSAMSKILANNPWVIIAAAVIALAFVIYKNWDKITAFVIGAWNKIKSAASTVWNAIVGVVKGAASKVWSAIQAYFNFYKSVAEFGLRIVQGLWDGIKNAAGWIKSKLQEFAGGVLNSLKDAFGISSPSKHTTKQGEELGYGVMKGLNQVEPKVKEKAKKLADSTVKALGDSFKKAAANNKNLVSGFKNAIQDALSSTTDAMSRIYDQVTAALEASKQAADDMVSAAQDKWQGASDALGSLREQATSFASSVRDSLRSVFSLRDALNPENGGSFLGNLRDQLKSFQTFSGQVRQLRSMGLNEASMQEIIQAGVEQGTQIAAAILAGGSGAVSEINSLEAQITASASELGDLFAKDKFGAELSKAEQNLNVAQQSLAAATSSRNLLIEQIDAAQKAADKILGKGTDVLDGLVKDLGTGLGSAERTIGTILTMIETKMTTLKALAGLKGTLETGLDNLGSKTTKTTNNKTVNVTVNVEPSPGQFDSGGGFTPWARQLAREIAAI